MLDCATTHTILRDPKYFTFSSHKADAWQDCDVTTIAWRRNFKFREGQTTIVLPGGTPLRCTNTMYSPTTPRSLISYQNLRANVIHVLSVLRNGEETLKLTQGPRLFITAHAGANGLCEIHILTIVR